MTFDDLAKRVEALEQRSIQVSDLPVSKLQRKLEQQWQPEAKHFLLPGTVTRDTMEQKLARGTGTATFAASADSAVLQVAHDLGRAPVAVAFASFEAGAGLVPSWNWGTPTATAFEVVAELQAAHTGDIDFTWIAFA